MKHFGIIANREKDPEGRFVRELAQYLTKRGCTAHCLEPMVPGEERRGYIGSLPVG